MKQSISRFTLGFCAFMAAVSGQPAMAASPTPVAFTGIYTQNFSSMGTGITAPNGWGVVSESGSHNLFAPSTASTPGTSTTENFTAGTLTTATTTVTHATPTGSADGASGYNWTNSAANIATGEGTESLGSCPSGNAATILELSLMNTSGNAINAVNIGYDIDRFTTTTNNNNDASGFPNTPVVGGVTQGLEEFPGYHLFYSLTPSVANSWVDVTALDPTNFAGTTGAVQVPNTVGITTISPTTLTLSSAWTAGSTIEFAWFDDNAEAPSPDQQIGLNNVSVQAIPEPASGWLGLIGLGALFTFLRLRRHQA